MLYNKEELNYINPISFLNETHHLDVNDSFNMFHPSVIPIVFNEELQTSIVDYNILNMFSIEHNISCNESLDILAEYNNIPNDSLIVAIDEYKIIENPDLLNDNIPFVFKAINEESFDVFFSDYLLEQYIETGDEFFLEAQIDSQKARKAMYYYNDIIDDLDTLRKKKDQEWIGDKLKTSDDAKQFLANKRQTLTKLGDMSGKFLDRFSNGTNVETAKKDINMFISQINTEIEHAPRTWLAKKIQSLRLLYATWLAKAEMAVNLKQANFFKMIASKILALIDKGLLLLQRGANKIGKEDYRYGVHGKW